MTDAQGGISGHPNGSRASDVIAAHLKRLRARRELTVKDLAARCADLGAPELTANVLTNIEVRRRDVSADELLILALALDVAPVHLLTPPRRSTTGLAVTATVAADPETAELWMRGDVALLASGAMDYLDYAAERAGPNPRGATDHAAAVLRARTTGLVAQYEAEAQQFLGKVRQQVSDLVTYLEESVTNGVGTDDLVQVLETVKARVQPTTAITSPRVNAVSAGPAATTALPAPSVNVTSDPGR
jgi:hypothetical protein